MEEEEEVRGNLLLMQFFCTLKGLIVVLTTQKTGVLLFII